MKTADSLVSVIVPIYNAAAWLQRCLDSIIGQSFQRLEIILINDGSTDESLAICQKYADGDPRIVLMDQENAGPSTSRNSGLERATGNFILFVDADDYIEPDMVQSLYAGMTSAGVDWVVCGCRQWTGTGSGATSHVIPLGCRGVQPPVQLLMGFARGDVKAMTTFASLWNKLYRADLIQQHNIRFETVCPGTTIPVYPQEDFFFNMRYLEQARNLFFLDRPLYHYQTHQTNTNAVRKYRPHAIPLHQEVYGAIRRQLWPVITPDERANFNRHFLDKTLIVMAILCRDNPIYGEEELVAAIAALAADQAVVSSLENYAAEGSQDNRLIDLVRNGDARSLYAWARKRGNEMYGP